MPPLAVLCHSGCTGDLFINVLLTIFGYIPGVIHAIYVICIAPQQQQQGIVLTTNVNVAQPAAMPMYQPVQPPPPPTYYPQPASAPPPPIYYADAAQKY